MVIKKLNLYNIHYILQIQIDLILNNRNRQMIFIDVQSQSKSQSQQQATPKDKNNIKDDEDEQSDPCIWLVVLLSIAMIILYSINSHKITQSQYTSLSQLYNFNIQGYIQFPTQKLIYNTTPIQWPQIHSTSLSGSVTAVFTTSGRYPNLNHTLHTFFQYNTYPLQQIIVINDGILDQQYIQLAKLYKNITWISTQVKIGQVAAVDVAYRFVKSQYVFHSEDDWNYLRSGFIQYCFYAFAKDHKISGVWLSNVLPPSKLIPNGVLNIATYKQNGRYSGHSFNPSLHKMSQYHKIPGGFSNLTFFSSYGKGAGLAQEIISIYFQMRGYYYAQSHVFFTQHATVMGSGQAKFFSPNLSSKVGIKMKKVFNDFQIWCKKMDKQKKFALDIPNLDENI